MKRFYKTVSVGGAAGNWTVELDGRPVLTPARHQLRLPNHTTAAAVAAEWTSQHDKIDPDHMPLTRLAATAIDRIEPNRDTVVDQIVSYAKTDALCYRDSEPAELVARQQRLWQPHLDWAASTYDAPLHVTRDLVAQDQPNGAINALRLAIDRLTAFELSALTCATAAAGSLIIALALYEGRLNAAAAFEVSHLEELYQAERWGDDAEAAARRDRIRNELATAATFFRLLREEKPL